MDDLNIKPLRTSKKPSPDAHLEFKEFMLGLEFDPGKIEADGILHRFGRGGSKDSGWYVAWENKRIKDGTLYVYGVFGDWREPDTKHEFKPSRLSKNDSEIIRAKRLKAQATVDRERNILADKARVKSTLILSSASAEGLTPYLHAKGLSRLYGAKRQGDTLHIPLTNIFGVLVGLQNISPDGSKKFVYGTAKKGAFFRIGESDGEALLCEGFATGATLHEATGKTVYVAFDAGNLVPVAEALMEKYPNLRVRVCGDDDKFKVVNGTIPNAGRIAAEKAALVCRSEAVFPIFNSNEGNPTDFNDLMTREGLKAVEAILSIKPSISAGFEPIGVAPGGKAFYVYKEESMDVLHIKDITKQILLTLAPLAYWQRRFPSEKSAFAFEAAMDDLIQSCLSKGVFTPDRLRGAGVWMDRGRVVVNTGESLYVDKRPTKSLSSKNVYLNTGRGFPYNPDERATIDECQPMIRLASLMNWEDKYLSPKIICGWVAVARLAGALPIRPHVWLTATRDAGKTTLMQDLVAKCLGSEEGRLSAQGDSTEAGLRQYLRGSSVPLIFDEFESQSEQSIERKKQIVAMLRSAWKNVEGKQFKGSSNGEAISYELNTPAFLASIRTSITDDADLSRFSFIELLPHKNDVSERNAIDKAISEIPATFGDRLFSRQAGNVSIILESYKVLRTVIATEGKVSRLSEQLGILLAGYHSLVSDKIVTPEEARRYIEPIDLKAKASEDIEADEVQCLNHLLASKIYVESFGTPATVDHFIGLAEAGDEKAKFGLKENGLLYNSDSDILKIADGHTQLKKLFRDTPWSGTWGRSLRRLPGAKKCGPSAQFSISRASSYRSTAIKLTDIRAKIVEKSSN